MYKNLWRLSEPNKFGFIGELHGKIFSPKMVQKKDLYKL